MNGSGIIWILGLLTAFGPMSIDMYLPSLPRIAEDLALAPGDVQLTLSAFFLGSAVGQLFYGPFSDRFGRRPMLIGGIVIYIITSAFCALSKSIRSLDRLPLSACARQWGGNGDRVCGGPRSI